MKTKTTKIPQPHAARLRKALYALQRDFQRRERQAHKEKFHLLAAEYDARDTTVEMVLVHLQKVGLL